MLRFFYKNQKMAGAVRLVLLSDVITIARAVRRPFQFTLVFNQFGEYAFDERLTVGVFSGGRKVATGEQELRTAQFGMRLGVLADAVADIRAERPANGPRVRHSSDTSPQISICRLGFRMIIAAQALPGSAWRCNFFSCSERHSVSIALWAVWMP